MRQALFALCALTLACGTSTEPTSDLKLKGTVTFTGTEYALDHSAWAWNEDSNGIPGVTDIALGERSAIVPFLEATNVEAPLEKVGFKAHLGGQLRVGPSRLELAVTGDHMKMHTTGQEPFALPAVIDRIRFNDDSLAAWTLTVKAKGEFDGQNRHGHSAKVTYDGTVTYHPICRVAGGVSSGRQLAYLCGRALETSHRDRPTLPAPQAAECPAELSAGVKPGDELVYDGSTLTIGDVSMDCVTTEQGSVVCGAEKKDVSAGGCTWQVDYLMLDTLYVYGRANDGCGHEKPLCNTIF